MKTPKKFVAVTKDGVGEIDSREIIVLESRGKLVSVAGVENEEQLKNFMIEMMADPRKPFKPRRFAQVFRVPYSKVKEWVSDKDIEKKVYDRVKEIMGGGVYLAQLYKRVSTQAMMGSFHHQKLLLEITKEYQPGMKLEHEVVSPEERFRRLERERSEKLSKQPNKD